MKDTNKDTNNDMDGIDDFDNLMEKNKKIISDYEKNIFNIKENTNKLNETNNKIIQDTKKIVPEKTPNNSLYPKSVDYQNKKYFLIGYASNPYYNQYYLLYER